jgi:hypothetical protein
LDDQKAAKQHYNLSPDNWLPDIICRASLLHIKHVNIPHGMGANQPIGNITLAQAWVTILWNAKLFLENKKTLILPTIWRSENRISDSI